MENNLDRFKGDFDKLSEEDKAILTDIVGKDLRGTKISFKKNKPSWFKHKSMTRKEYGKYFWYLLILGIFLNIFQIVLIKIVGSAFILASLGSGIMWLCLTFKKDKG